MGMLKKSCPIGAVDFSYLRFMRWIIIFVALVSFPAVAQKEIKLKRKFLGSYKGMVPAYEINTGEELIPVGETPIYVSITKSDISVTIGNREITGTHNVMFEADSYFLLDCEMTNQLANERILVYKRGKRLSRDGMFPQPVTELKKYKSK